MASITVKGLEGLKAAFIAAGNDAPKFAGKALYEEAQEAFLLSQNVVPVEFGTLRSSGVVHPPVWSGTSAMAKITYGTDYAIYVHEIPPNSGGRWGTGAKHAPPTAWKYLENPVKAYAKSMGPRMVQRVLDMVNAGF